MTTTHLRFAADILKRLGEELNPNVDHGILELVKNAYDADAINCVIEFYNTDRAGGTILISDDGNGMQPDDILNGWLLIGKSAKSFSSRTNLGRIPAGSKGLGRLAALRMGRTATMVTRPVADSESEYELTIDWQNYDAAQVVEDVALELRSRPAKKNAKHGTKIELQQLSQAVDKISVKRLARSLILLADPFADDPHGFQPRLIAPEFEELSDLIQKRYFDLAEYHLRAEVDSVGNMVARAMDWKGNVLYSATHKELAARRNGAPYECPPAEFDLWLFLLKKETFSLRGAASLGEVRVWLQEFGGVHLFNNGLRVPPYGSPGNDWLEMNLRRARSPEERPSTNNSIGRISVTASEDYLFPKTDRSGFVENESFQDLRIFAQDALDWLARKRIEQREKSRSKERQEATQASKVSTQEIEEKIARLPPADKADIGNSFVRYRQKRDEEVEKLRREVQLYRTLSTAGITAATFAHESSGNPIKTISLALNSVETRAREALPYNYERVLGKPVEAIRNAVASLAVLGSATLRLIDHEKRRRSKVSIHRTIINLLNTFHPFLDGRDVTVQKDLDDVDCYIWGSEAALESVVTNLITNSLNAFEYGGIINREIVVKTHALGAYCSIHVLDNGPGITGIDVADIWLPGESTRPSGTGLGLTIVRDTTVDLGGSVQAIPKGELGGAEFIITLPILDLTRD